MKCVLLSMKTIIVVELKALFGPKRAMANRLITMITPTEYMAPIIFSKIYELFTFYFLAYYK